MACQMCSICTVPSISVQPCSLRRQRQHQPSAASCKLMLASGLLYTSLPWTLKAAKLQVTVCSGPVQDTGPARTHSSQQQGTHITYAEVLHNQQLPDIGLVHQQA